MGNINQHTQRLLEAFLNSLADAPIVEAETELYIASVQAQFYPGLEFCSAPATALFLMLQKSLRRLRDEAGAHDFPSVPGELHAVVKLSLMLDLVIHERSWMAYRLDGALQINWDTLRDCGVSDVLQKLCLQCLSQVA